MSSLSLSTPTVVYVMDAYCGWCWGFSERMQEFEAANRGRVAFTAISGGLFLGNRATAIANYPHIPEANKRISKLTGAVFGEDYQALVRKGEAVMDSQGPAQGLAALRAQAPERAVHWAHELQAAFYQSGLSLSDHATIVGIAKTNGLNINAVLDHLETGLAESQALADFAKTQRLGISSYPTLLYIEADRKYPMPATGTALSILNQRLDDLMTKSSST